MIVTSVMVKGPASDQQVDALADALRRSEVFIEVLRRAGQLALPGWYLAAGCVAQTAWNILGDRTPDHGIRDYDLPYFDPSDLTWEAEDLAIQAANEVFARLTAVVEVRNEAQQDIVERRRRACFAGSRRRA